MAKDSENGRQNWIPRRTWLKGVGFATTGAVSGLAGCGSSDEDGGTEAQDGDGGGGDGDGDGDGGGGDGDGGGGDGDGGDDEEGEVGAGEAGERVPTLQVSFWSDAGGATRVMEAAMTPFISDMEELGFSLEPMPQGISNQVNETIEDARTSHIEFGSQGPSPSRLDPDQLTYRYNIFRAGNNSGYNPANYASCEYSEYAIGQRSIGDKDERQEAVMEAWRISSEDVGWWPLVESFSVGAVNTDQLEVEGIGEMGVGMPNINPVIKSAPQTDRGIIMNASPEAVESRLNNITQDGLTGLSIFNFLIYSPLVQYDENFEGPQPSIAEDWEITDGGETITFSLHDDAQFHNGDEITAEDVKFTYEFIIENHGVIPEGSEYPINEVEVVDEKTARFHQDVPYLGGLENVAAKWGIIPKDIWEENGARENPDTFDLPEIVGSGPFQVENFSQESLHLSSFDGHPVHKPETDSLIFAIHESVDSAQRAFRAGELNMLTGISVDVGEQLEEGGDVSAEMNVSGSFTMYHAYPWNSHGPGQFKAFREAGAWAINRDQINEVVSGGEAETTPYAAPMTLKHPYCPANNLEELENDVGLYVQDSGGDKERAQEILEEAGWTLDDDGRIHYPEDADLTPPWPKGSEPAEHPDKFPCVEELDPSA